MTNQNIKYYFRKYQIPLEISPVPPEALRMPLAVWQVPLYKCRMPLAVWQVPLYKCRMPLQKQKIKFVIPVLNPESHAELVSALQGRLVSGLIFYI